MTSSSDDLDRREALKLIAGGLGLAALGGTAACAPATSAASSSSPTHLLRSAGPAPDRFLAAPPIDTVRIGFVGVGGQGTAHVENLLRIEGCVIKAVDDIVPEKVTRIQDLVEHAGFPRLRAGGAGPGIPRHALGVARPDLPRGDAQWQAHRHRGARRLHRG